MPAVIMDGKALAAGIKDGVRGQVERMAQKPGLAVVLIGEDPASRVYADGKRRDCAQCGIYSEEYVLPDSASQAELLELVSELDNREDIDGLLVQMPLPEPMDSRAVIRAVRPDKDVDCFHPFNMGRLITGEPGFLPCTPAGVMRLLREYGVDPAGKRCTIVGRSNVVGKPLAMLMLRADATVTICHTRTADLREACAGADILVAAAGCPGLITGDMVKEGAVVVDVAVNRDETGGLCGDVDYAAALERAALLTPVPGGVGPVTRAMLMENTLRAARLHGKE